MSLREVLSTNLSLPMTSTLTTYVSLAAAVTICNVAIPPFEDAAALSTLAPSAVVVIVTMGANATPHPAALSAFAISAAVNGIAAVLDGSPLAFSEDAESAAVDDEVDRPGTLARARV